MRPLLAALLFATSACVATQVQLHRCPSPCGDGQVCDATVGECKLDPCNGRCNLRIQRCKAGPPPKCVDLNVGEAQEAGPGEPSAPQEPQPQSAPFTH